MKFNKWTLGLAAVGAVSLTSAARAEEKPNYLQTSVPTTVLSGYVDTSINWNPGTGNKTVPGYSYNNPGKQDGFNLNAVKISLSKPMDETEWSAGYDVDVFLGTDGAALAGANGLGVGQAFKQAYVSLRTPIAGTSGIDWKLGVWDTIIGYESTESPNNPNFTRSYGYTIEPTTHTGIQGTYKISDEVSLTLGMANTSVSAINVKANGPKAESYKTYLGSVAFTAPTNWGALSGSSLYAGFINGIDTLTFANAGTRENFYIGSTLNTPLSTLKVGFSYDYLNVPQQNYTANGGGPVVGGWANALDLYATFQATDKLSFNSRAEYFWERGAGSVPVTGPDKIIALTETVQYDLWKNVLSRLEVRWDHQAGSLANVGGTSSGGAGTGVGAWGGDLSNPASVGGKRNSYTFIADIAYKF